MVHESCCLLDTRQAAGDGESKHLLTVGLWSLPKLPLHCPSTALPAMSRIMAEISPCCTAMLMLALPTHICTKEGM